MEHHELNEVTGERQHQFLYSVSELSEPSSATTKTIDHGNRISETMKERTSCMDTTPKQLFIVIGSLYLGTFLVALDTTIIGTAIPSITTEFRAFDAIAWYSSSYLLTLTALQPTFGKLYKVISTKLLYLCCIAIFEFGSILCAAAKTSPMFIAGRAVAGCGAAGLMQGSFAIVLKTIPLSKRPFYFGLFVGAFAVSVGIGPVLGGTFADNGIWRWCFWINVPLGAVVTLLIVVFLDLVPIGGSARPTCSLKQMVFQLDPAGSILIIASSCCLLLAMQWGGQSLPWASPTIIAVFVLSGSLLALFLLVEWKMGSEASVPFAVLKQRSIAFSAVYLFLFSMPNFAYGVYIPMFFQTAKGFTAQRSGAEVLALSLTQIMIVVVVGALVSKFGYYTPFIILGTAISVIGSGLITLLKIETTHAEWVAYFVICGLGTGCAVNLPYTAVSTVLNETDMVTGNALLQFAFQLGGAVSLCVCQTIFLGGLSSEIRSTMSSTSVNKITDAGAHGLMSLNVPPTELHTLQLAYQKAAHGVFVFLLIAAGLALIATFGMEHKNVKKVDGHQRETGQDSSDHGV